jgi:hypothetical protein
LQASRVAPYSDPLDVLWRCVPTPYRAVVHLAAVRVIVESNDPQVPEAVAARADHPAERGQSSFLWKIVRDVEAPGPIEPTRLFQRGELRFANMGAALTVAVDRDRRELLSFISGDVDERIFRESALPLFVRLMLDAVGQQTPGADLEGAAHE